MARRRSAPKMLDAAGQAKRAKNATKRVRAKRAKQSRRASGQSRDGKGRFA